MGQDYAARKAAKKRRKSVESGAGEHGSGAKRRAGSKNRRLCRGMCYGTPVITSEDLQELGNSELKSPFLQKIVAGLGLNEEGTSRGRKRRLQACQDGNGLKLGTGIKLEDTIQAAAVPIAKRSRDSVEDQPVTLSAAFDVYPDQIRNFMAGEGFPQPTPIQERVWPLALTGADVAAVAEPGSGKTLAYLLPSAARLSAGGHALGLKPVGPALLVLVPSRELARQVSSSCRPLWRHFGLRTACVYGGVDKAAQVAALSQHPHLLVATPGRLLELLREGCISTANLSIVVVDEADKMLSMGFEVQLSELRGWIMPQAVGGGAGPVQGTVGSPHPPPQRPQLLFLTATLPDSLEAVLGQWLDSEHHSVRLTTQDSAVSKTVTQVVHVCAEHKKLGKLLKYLRAVQEGHKGQRNFPKILIFANRVKVVRFLCEQLAEAGLKVGMLHGDRSQGEREAALTDFRSGKVPILVASDVAGRGLHVRNLPYIVNYDFPSNLDQYIHRVGRTGRLSATGHCFSFLTRNLAPLAEPLLNLLRSHGQQVDPNLVTLADAYRVAAEKLAQAAAAGGADSHDEADQPKARVSGDEVLRNLGLRSVSAKKKDKLRRRKTRGGGVGRGLEERADAAVVQVEGAVLEEEEHVGVDEEFPHPPPGLGIRKHAKKEEGRKAPWKPLLGRLRKKLMRERAAATEGLQLQTRQQFRRTGHSAQSSEGASGSPPFWAAPLE